MATAGEDDYPKRIISLGPDITEELYLLGTEDKIAAVTTYCRRPLRAKEKVKVGTMMELNIEKAISLKPDLVLATGLTDLKAQEKLKTLGIKVVTFPLPRNFEAINEQLLTLGKLVGKEEISQDIVNKAKNRVNYIREKVSHRPKAKVFIQVGAKPLFTITKNYFVNDFIEFAGGINAVQSDIGLYSREKVLSDNPDIIIIATMEIDAEEEKNTWYTYKNLNAVKNKKVYIIDSYTLCSPTPLSFAQTLAEVAKILHPEVMDK